MEKLEGATLPITGDERIQKSRREPARITLGFKETALLLCLFLGWKFQVLSCLLQVRTLLFLLSWAFNLRLHS